MDTTMPRGTHWLIDRVKAILLTPKSEWPIIASESSTIADIYKHYVLLLAAVPAVAGFLKSTLVGYSIPFAGTVRVGIGAGLSGMVLQYVLSLVGVYVLALIVDALAPTFGAQKDRTQAFKLAAYSYTAGWVAGIGQIVPWLALLFAIAGGIYSIYLFYLGLPHTMKCQQDKAAGYTALVIVIAIAINIVIGIVVGGVAGTGAALSGGMLSSSHDDVKFDKDSPLGRLEQWGQQMEKAGKQFEEAQKSGDSQAQADAMSEIMGATLGGGRQVESLAPDRLKPLVPETANGLTRTSLSVERNGALGMQMSEARATYANEAGHAVTLEIRDLGTASGLAAFAGWALMDQQREDDHGYEKTHKEDGRIIHEQWNNTTRSGEYAVVIAERFVVKASGAANEIDDLKTIVEEVDLSALEELKDEGVTAAR